MSEIINFTDCEIDRTAAYEGSDQKRAIIYNGKRYMLKFSDRIPDEKRNSLNSSYSNSYLSEYIGCHILQTLGLRVQNTLLGTYERKSSKGELLQYPVVACENFLRPGENLIEFKKIEAALLDGRPPKVPALNRLNLIFGHENEYFSEEFCKIAKEEYYNILVADSLIGNFDRHGNNWGYIVDIKTNQIKGLAPIYDCGSSLYPQLADDELLNIANSQEEVQKRIDVFPKMALSYTENGEKLSYKEYLLSLENNDLNDAIVRITPKIDFEKIYSVIDNTPGLVEERKYFYKVMLTERYNQILIPTYNKLAEVLRLEEKPTIPNNFEYTESLYDYDV